MFNYQTHLNMKKKVGKLNKQQNIIQANIDFCKLFGALPLLCTIRNYDYLVISMFQYNIDEI